MKSWFAYLKGALSHRSPEDKLVSGPNESRLRANLINLLLFIKRHWRKGALGALRILLTPLLAFPSPLFTRYLIDKIFLVAQVAGIHEFISALSNGYQERVGERGINLSEGQIQRWATVQDSDRDLRLNEKQLVATDTHEKLLRNNDYYRSLVANQSFLYLRMVGYNNIAKEAQMVGEYSCPKMMIFCPKNQFVNEDKCTDNDYDFESNRRKYAAKNMPKNTKRCFV